jgi:crossover junction endodeoxyribonuclease RuvC
MIKILGLDPGLLNTGVALVEFENEKASIIKIFTIKTNPKNDIGQRLLKIFTYLRNELNNYKIDLASVEKTLVNKNAVSSMDLSMARGICLLYLAENNIKYDEYLPTFIKKSITGTGKADEFLIQNMLKYYLIDNFNLSSLNHHEIDALAIAINYGLCNR